MTQLVTRAPDGLAAEVDRLVADGALASRSQAVREGLALLVDRLRRVRTEEAIVEGYRKLPQTEQEVGWADEATRRMIAEEPW